MIQPLSGNDLPKGVGAPLRQRPRARIRDRDGDDLFITAEASHAADERDSRRNIRNAELISQLSGVRTVPVVASLKNNHSVQRLVDDGQVQYFRFR